MAQYGSPIPVLWGTHRVSTNLLDYFGYHSTGSGKGGVTGSKTGKSGNYSANVALGFCVGPAGPRPNNSIWLDAGVTNTNRVPLNFFAGYDGQPADQTFLSSSPNTPVVGYSGLCYATATPMQFGQAGVLPNLSVEINGFRTGTAGNNTEVIVDASPALIVYDMLYDPRVGIGFPGVPADPSLFQTYCQAALFGFSLLCDRQQPTSRWIEEVLELTSSAVVWSSGRLMFIPYSTEQLDNNDAVYYPNLTPVANLTDDDFIPWSVGTSHQVGEKDVVLATRNDVSQLTNWLTLEIMYRPYWYDPLVQPPTFDQASIELYGVRNIATVQAHEVCTQTVGGNVASTMLKRRHTLRRTYKFKVGIRWMLLEPMDIVTITDPTYLTQFNVRLTAVEEDEGGVLTITAEDLV